jgi:diaminohydroxyphosphoribosylaminopyrimidine deaminase/5-amino-6-(5-phosphoribosylamino)uracil reductase
MGVLHVHAEGGGRTAAWLLKEGAANRLELFLAPKILGSSGIAAVGDMGTILLKDAPVLSYRRIRRIGEDVQITADVK